MTTSKEFKLNENFKVIVSTECFILQKFNRGKWRNIYYYTTLEAFLKLLPTLIMKTSDDISTLNKMYSILLNYNEKIVPRLEEKLSEMVALLKKGKV